MTARVVIGIVLVAVAVVAALGVERRRRAANAPVRDSYPVPRQLHRADFDRPEAPWLVALFSSSTCDSCALVRDRLRGLVREGVVVCDLEFPAARELHERYAISGVPMVLIADAEGVVRESFVGSVTSADLMAALDRVRSQP
jgi:hypothetical protein